MLRTKHRRTRRRGSLYVAVLGVTMIVGMLALAAMHVARLNLKAATGRNDRYEATVLAASAVENGLMVLDSDPSWRTNLASGDEYPATPVTLGRGSFTWKLVDDEDADLGDDLSDSVLLQGAGRVGGVTHVEQVRLQPTDVGLTCLEASLHCEQELGFFGGPNITTNQMVSSNANIWANGGSEIFGNAEAVGWISALVSGSETTGITPRQMPDSDVFDYYVNMGTLIDIDLLPIAGGKHMLEKVVLSPQNNPYGNLNPEGIYVIDCQGQVIRIKLVRLLGTLVLLNPGSGSDLDNDMHFEPAVANYPTLLVQGDITFDWHGDHNLRESMAEVNYNPPGTPYLGQEDTDMDDEYPPLIKGITYVSGNLTVTHECAMSGSLVVGGTLIVDDDITLTYDAIHLNSPPPGFAAGSTMAITPGSWTRAPSP